VAGDGGLLVDAFTHSEVANGTILWAIAFAARAQVTRAIAATGVTFFINAFMAVWTALPLAMQTAHHLLKGSLSLRQLGRGAIFGGVLFLVAALPVVANVVSNPDFGSTPNFDFVEYLSDFWPDHFLVWKIPAIEIALLAGMFFPGAVAARALGPDGHFVFLTLIGFGVVWLVGAALPYLTSSPTMLMLHLLRSNSAIQITSTLALAGIATLWTTSPNRPEDRFFGWAIAALLTLDRTLLAIPAILLVFALRRFGPIPPRTIVRAAPLVSVGIAIIAAQVGWDAYERNQRRMDRQGDWRGIARWAKANTPPGAQFLLPVGWIKFRPNLTAEEAEQQSLVWGSEVFIFTSRRQVWVTAKQGAAVMWSPSYYFVWKNRMEQALALRSLPARLRFARAQGIDYVINSCDPAQHPVAKSGSLCAYTAAQQPR
jgi:hypothetical protein